MIGAGRYAVDRLRSRGVPMNDRVEALVCHLVDAAPAHRHAADSLRDVGMAPSTARYWCAKKQIPAVRQWHSLGRALHYAEQIQGGDTTIELARRYGYADHSSVSWMLMRTLGVSVDRVREASMAELLDGWLAREVDGVGAAEPAGPFRKVRKTCSGPYRCGKRVQTLAYVAAPICRSCRRRMKNLKLAPYRLKWGS